MTVHSYTAVVDACQLWQALVQNTTRSSVELDLATRHDTTAASSSLPTRGFRTVFFCRLNRPFAESSVCNMLLVTADWSASLWPVLTAANLINVARADLLVLHVMLSLLVF